MSDKYQDLIDDYLRGKLSPELQREVEQLARADERFRAELEFSKETKLALARQRHEELRKRLQGLNSPPLQKQFKLPRYAWVAAAALLLFGTIGLYQWASRQTQSQATDLYIAYFEPYPNVSAPVTRSAAEYSERLLAYNYYEQGNFGEAYTQFLQLPDEERQADPELLFYAGVSALAVKDFDNALTLLRQYQDWGSVKLLRQAKWYEALTLLQQGEREAAQKILLDLAGTPGYKQTEAVKMLKRI